MQPVANKITYHSSGRIFRPAPAQPQATRVMVLLRYNRQPADNRIRPELKIYHDHKNWQRALLLGCRIRSR
jgi:hypothetical protein